MRHIAVCTVLLVAATLVCAQPCPDFPRPDHTDYARMARWLVHQNTWGVVSTLSVHLDGLPFGNALSFADGPACLPTGRLLFYLSPMDATAQDLAVNSSASLTVHELQMEGACKGVDPEDPTCAKLTLSGSLLPVPQDELLEAEHLLFDRHPDMRDWPAGHAFRIYELHIATARLLDYYGGPHDLTPVEYFAADPVIVLEANPASAAHAAATA